MAGTQRIYRTLTSSFRHLIKFSVVCPHHSWRWSRHDCCIRFLVEGFAEGVQGTGVWALAMHHGGLWTEVRTIDPGHLNNFCVFWTVFFCHQHLLLVLVEFYNRVNHGQNLYPWTLYTLLTSYLCWTLYPYGGPLAHGGPHTHSGLHYHGGAYTYTYGGTYTHGRPTSKSSTLKSFH